MSSGGNGDDDGFASVNVVGFFALTGFLAGMSIISSTE
jgi:hypothetical protein